MIEALWRDVRYAVRTLLRQPTFAAVAVGTLALGIGATTAVFSVVDGLLLRDLPYDEPDELVTVWLDMTRLDGPPREWFTYADLEDYRAEPQLFEEMGAWGGWGPTLTVGGTPTVVSAAVVTAGLLDGVLGAETRLGRGFTAEEDLPGGPDVVVVSHGFWTDRMESDPDAVGRTVVLDERSYTVVGVMREGFQPPFVPQAELWAPMQFDVSACGRGCYTIRTVARLAPSVGLEVGRARATALADRLAGDFPDTNGGVGVALVPLQDDLVRPAARALWVLLGAVGALLLMACTNVANLLLARGTSRGGEISLRGALGADRGSLFRQLLTESLVLALVGGGAGLALGAWGTELLLAIAPPLSFPGIEEVGVDGRILLFAFSLTVGTALVFGLFPALYASRTALAEGVRKASGGGGGWGAGLRNALVVTQVALALVLLVGSGLLLRSFRALTVADMGFDPEGVLAVDLALPASRFAEGPARVGFYDELQSRMEAIPGVVSVGATNSLPLAGNDGDSDFRIEGEPPPSPTDPTVAWIRRVTRGYFETMGIELLAGAEFGPGDVAGAPGVVIVNETLARRYLGYPERSPLGVRVTFSGGDDPVWRTIVGVARDTRHFGIRDASRPAMYFPYAQVPSPAMSMVLRTEGDDPLAIASASRAVIAAIDPGLAPSSTRPLAELVRGAVSVERFVGGLLALFAALAVVLASVGLYGVVSFGVNRRAREIGIRLALGAKRGDVRRLVLGGGAWLAAGGVALGLAGSWALSGFLGALLYEVPPGDPTTFLAMAGLLAGVALIATWVPAVRASRCDPVEVLRVD